MIKPLFIHDCPKCQFAFTRYSKALKSDVDVYESCQQVDGAETQYLVRFSDEGPDYASTDNLAWYV